MKKFNDINYRPLLEPEESYRSDIDPNKFSNARQDEDENKTIEEDNIYKAIDDTLESIQILPDNIYQIVYDNIQLIKTYTPNLGNKPIADKDTEFSISGIVWFDKNKDGVYDYDEKVLSGKKVILIGPDNKTKTCVTDSNGVYFFDKLPAGIYDVKLSLSNFPGNAIITHIPDSINLGIKHNIENQNIGCYYITDSTAKPSSEPDNKEPSNKGPDDEDPNLPIIIPTIKNPIIKKEDIEHDTFIEIIQDYLIAIQNIILDYSTDILYYLSKIENKDMSPIEKEYDIDTYDLPKHLRHIGDEIIKSQIIKEQKYRLCKKVANEDTLFSLLEQLMLTKTKIERYHDCDYMDEYDIINKYNNRELSNTINYTKRQNKNCLYNLYKQLHSSNLLIEDYMDMYIREIQLKIILIKEGAL